MEFWVASLDYIWLLLHRYHRFFQFSQAAQVFFCFSTTTTVTHWTDFEIEQDPFTVCLLATDKEEDSMYKLVRVNVVNGEERTITEVPYRNNCAMIFVAGMLVDVCSKDEIIAQAIWVGKRQLSKYQQKCSENSTHIRPTHFDYLFTVNSHVG